MYFTRVQRRAFYALFFMISFTNEVGAVSLVNSRDDFVRFLSKWDISSEEQKYVEWNNFEEKYADIYSEIVFNHASPSWAQTKQKSLSELFAALPEIKEGMLSLYDSAEAVTQKGIQSLKKVVPDFTDNLIFVFLPTAFRFNGMETVLSSRRHDLVIIGVDAVVKWKNNIDVLLAHELFHKHHYEKMELRSNFSNLASNFWIEGLATYVSELVHPEADFATVLHSQELAEACKNPEYVRDLAKKYMEVFYRTFIENEKPKFLREWFWLESDSNPKRPGYCLGYQIAKTVAKSYPINEMVQWGSTTYEEHVERALKQIIKN